MLSQFFQVYCRQFLAFHHNTVFDYHTPLFQVRINSIQQTLIDLHPCNFKLKQFSDISTRAALIVFVFVPVNFKAVPTGAMVVSRQIKVNGFF